MAIKYLTSPISDSDLAELQIGDQVYLSGTIYTGRDTAHKRLIELLKLGKELPIDLKGQMIYYVGPSPAKPGEIIGSAGPTTSYRMDAYSVPLIEKKGLKVMIGKGSRCVEVKKAMKEHKAIYLAAIGGAAALITKSILESDVVAYPELGPEAIRKLKVKNFPAIVVNDIYGGDLYDEGVQKYREE